MLKCVHKAPPNGRALKLNEKRSTTFNCFSLS